MTNFAPITYVDVLPVMGGLFKRRNDFAAAGFDTPAQTIELRRTANQDGTGEIVNAPLLKEWVNMGAVLARIQRAVAVDLLGLAFIEALPPRSQAPWRAETGDYFDQHRRLHVALATNPGCLMYAGPQTFHMAVGHLVEVNARAPGSAANFGEHPRYHLVVDVRRAEA